VKKKKTRSMLQGGAPTRRQLRRRIVIDKVVRLYLSSQAIPEAWRKPGRLEREALEILEAR
jgi:hypothetical protein